MDNNIDNLVNELIINATTITNNEASEQQDQPIQDLEDESKQSESEPNQTQNLEDESESGPNQVQELEESSTETETVSNNQNNPFRFNTNITNNLKNLDFMKGYKFNFPNQNSNINAYVSILFSNYLKKKFFKINEMNERFIKNNSLLTEKENNKIIILFEKIILIKNFFRKYLYRESKLNKPFTIKTKKNWEILNETDLSLNKFKDEDNYILIKNYSTKQAYKFKITDILKLYKHSIYNSNGDFVYPSPKQLVNPYTGETITLKQHVDIYNNLLKFYSKKVKCLPNYICNFKGSYFNITRYMSRFNTDLFYRSAYYYVNNFTNTEWDESFIDYILSFPSIKKTFCKICFKKFQNRRKLFTKVLVIGNLNDNNIFSYGDGINIYIKLAKEHSLFFSNSHVMNHRLRRNRTRTGRLNRSRFYTSIGTNTNYRRPISNNFLLPSNSDSQASLIQTFTNPLFRRSSLLIENRSSFNSPLPQSELIDRPRAPPPPPPPSFTFPFNSVPLPPPPIRIPNIPLLNLSAINNTNEITEINNIDNNNNNNNLNNTNTSSTSDAELRELINLTVEELIRNIINEV